MSLSQRIRNIILWLSTPFQRRIQVVGAQESRVPDEAVEAVERLAQPGDILLSYEFHKATSGAIKGTWKHAAILNDILKVVDCVGDEFVVDPVTGIAKNVGGCRVNSLTRWLHQMDGVALIRPITPIEGSNLEAAKNANKYVGRNYDYEFRRGNDTLYCSELPYVCYVEEFESFLWYHPNDKEILPSYYRDMCEEKPQHFKLVFEYKGTEYEVP
jgi:hypothetical protein